MFRFQDSTVEARIPRLGPGKHGPGKGSTVRDSSLPRKILSYRTPDEAFKEELDKIYQVKTA